MEPIPPEMLAECRRLVRIHYGSVREPDAMFMASIFARGMQHARQLDKDEREAYEAERAEWEAEREAIPEGIVFDVNVKLPDQVVEDLKAKFKAAVEGSGTRYFAQIAPEPPEFIPWKEMKEKALREERERIRKGSHMGFGIWVVPNHLLEEKDE